MIMAFLLGVTGMGILLLIAVDDGVVTEVGVAGCCFRFLRGGGFGKSNS